MERERLTITLRRDILKLVDKSIDGAKLRNRSHAIEYFLSRELSPKQAKVVVAIPSTTRMSYQAGGMRVSASLQGLDSQEKLRKIFNQLASQNYEDVVIVGIDKSDVQTAVSEAAKLDLEVRAIDMETLGTEGEISLKSLSDYIEDEPFIYWDARFTAGVDLSALWEFHINNKNLATAAVTYSPDEVSGIGGFKAQVSGTDIKVIDKEFGLPLVGLLVFESGVFNEINESDNIYENILPKLTKAGKLGGFIFMVEQAVEQPARKKEPVR